MEYERIHKVQTGIISPSKLRMKLTGNHHQKKKDGSNCNSSRTSPSRLEDSEFVNNSLLATQTSDFQEQYSRLDAAESMMNANQGADDSNSDQTKEKRGAAYAKKQQVPKTEGGNSSSVHPVKGYEDENLDYDSTSSFEFHKGERSTHHYSMSARPSSRPMSSKWNDAEKWIMNRQNVQVNSSKKVQMQNQANRVSMLRVASECSGYESRTAVKRVDFCQPAMAERFGFAHPCPQSQSNGANAALLDLCTESKDLTEVDNGDSCTQTCVDDQTGIPAIRSVCMRDMGTEMTPIPSQEPSRTATPVGATTPLRTPTSSIPSTPRRGDPAPTPAAHNFNSNPSPERHNKTKLSEQEVKMKARRDIAALGVQLGKMNIAAWASKDESNTAEVRQSEYAKSAAAWEEAEKSKHVARFKREEIKIQEWESEQKAKLEAEMRKIEVQVEQIRADAQAKIVKKIRATLEKSEEKRASAEARRNRQSEKAAEQAEYIRQTGRLPSSSFMCCGWSS